MRCWYSHESMRRTEMLLTRGSKVYSFLLLAYHRYGAVGVADYRIRDTAYKRPLDPAQTPAAQDKQTCVYLPRQLNYLYVCLPHPQMRLGDRPSRLSHLLH